MSTPLVCAITGATGAVGPAVVEAFERAGFAVRAIGHVDGPLTADVTDFDQVRRAIDGADCVVHAAAKLHINNPSPELESEYRRVNVGGTENVVRAASEAGARRIVFFSTIAVYGGNRGVVLTEDDAPQPDGVYARTKLEAEHIVLGAAGTVLRLAAVYGPRVKGNYARLLDAVSRRRFAHIGDGRNRRTLVYERDVAAAAALAASDERAAGEIFNVTDGAVHTLREIVDAVAAAAGVRPPWITVPAGPARLAAGAVEKLARLVHVRPAVSGALVEKILEDVAVSGEKIQRRLRFSPAYDLQRGWSETVERLRQHP